MEKSFAEQLSPEIDYTTFKINNHSTVMYHQISPQGASSITLGTSSGVVGPVEFLIPPKVFNPSKCRLTYDINLGAVTAGSTGTTARFRWVNANLGTMINRVTLYDSATSAVLCDVNNFEKFTNQVAPAGEHIDHYLGKSSDQGATNLFPSATEATAKATPKENVARNNIIGTANYRGVSTNVVVGSDYTGRRLFYISPQLTDDGTTCYLSVNLNFEDLFRFTALSLDKNLYNPANMVLQIYFNPNNAFQFSAPSASDASTTQTAVGVGAILSNLKVQLASESNIGIQAQVINMVMNQGLTIPVSYPTVTRQAFSTTTSPSYNLALTSGYGKRILAILTSPFNLEASSLIGAENLHPATRANLTYYQTTLNSVPIKTPSGFDTTKSEDWTIGNSIYLSKSPTQSLAYYIDADWVHIDSWFGEKALCELDQTKIDGIDVATQSQTYQFTATTASKAQTWVSSILGQKLVSFTRQGAMIA